MLPTLKILRTHLIFISPSHMGLPPSYDSKGIRGIFLRDCTHLSKSHCGGADKFYQADNQG